MDVKKLVKSVNGFNSFNPMQKKALKNDLLSSSVIVSSPTSSGKTIVAELAAINSIMNEKKKVVYTCPLKALASEHFTDFKKKYSKEHNVKINLSIGDFDSKGSNLGKFDLIFTTYEKLESLLRHKANWLSSVGLLVIDEIHEIDSDRGPTIEIITTKLKMMNPKLKVLGLSATIPNAKELSSWLSAKLVESDYRPVPLEEGINFLNKVIYRNNEEILEDIGTPNENILHDTLKKEKQILFFANSRRNAEALAKKLADSVYKKLSEKEKKELEKVSEKALNALEKPTEQCKLLSSLIAKGISFHHAGLMQKQRTLIEESFREGKIKALSSTPTLAMGVNAPAHTVVISSVYRYTKFGSERIPVREYKQQVGRAGRPKYDTQGRSVIIAKSETDVDLLMEKFVNGKIEEITSKLSVEPVLRMHLLSLVATNFVFDLKSMEDFFSKTFYAEQYGNLKELFRKLSNVLSELADMKFIKLNSESFEATMLGKRVAELFLDPLTANSFIATLKENEKDYLAYLFLLSESFELYPYLRVSQAKESLIWGELLENKKDVFGKVEAKMYEETNLVEKYYLSKLFFEWINERNEDELAKEFNVQPGILRSKLQIIDWLIYASIELERILGRKTHLTKLSNLRLRTKYGVKEELLPLVQLKNIGRVRARMLYNNGIRSLNQIKKADIVELAKVLGKKVAINLKEQLGQKVQISSEKISKLETIERKGQTSLNHFK